MDFNYEKLLKDFKRIIDERSVDSLKYDLYRFLVLYTNFIAHYNLKIFKFEYRDRNFIRFVEFFTNPELYLPIRQDEEKEKLIDAMREYAKQHEMDILIEMKNRLDNEKVKKLQALANELGYDVVKKGTTEKVELLSVEPDGQLGLF